MDNGTQQGSNIARQEIDFIDIVTVLWKRRGLIVVTTIVSLIFAIGLISGLISFESKEKVKLISSIKIGNTFISSDLTTLRFINAVEQFEAKDESNELLQQVLFPPTPDNMPLMTVLESKELLQQVLFPSIVEPFFVDGFLKYEFVEQEDRKRQSPGLGSTINIYLICDYSEVEFFSSALNKSIELLVAIQNESGFDPEGLTPSRILLRATPVKEPETLNIRLIGLAAWIFGIGVGVIVGIVFGSVLVFFVETISQAKARLKTVDL